MRKRLIAIVSILFLTLMALSLVQNTYAQESPNENLVDIRLMAERTNVKGGDEIWIGIEQSITPHWHTYWKNPGDSGTATNAAWNLEGGFEISEILWPTPKRLPFGPLVNYGYEGNVILIQKLKLPKNLPPGPITLSADIELLVCKEECIPEYGTYSLTLNDPVTIEEDNAGYFENALARLPVNVDWAIQYEENGNNLKTSITLPKDFANSIDPASVQFFPYEWGMVDNAKMQSSRIDENILTINQERGQRDLNEIGSAPFVLAFDDKAGKSYSFEITANSTASLPQTPNTAPEQNITIVTALFFALLGGLILNLMPCVFPVLSIKALSLVKISDESPALARAHGLAYTAGVMLSFIAIAAILLALKSAGAQIGWGFQLQNPIVVGGLAYLLFILGLNLMGYFEIGSGLGNAGNKLTQGNGLNSSFFTGVLATLVATPCTAPFMAGAIGFALTQTTFVNLTIFTALGFGLALPYLLLSFIPALQKVMPKPGAWMNTFKQFLAFPMFGAAIWLVWVVSKQAGSTGTLQMLVGMISIAFGIWLLGKTSKIGSKILAILLFLIAAFMLIMPSAQTPTNSSDLPAKNSHEFGEVFTPEKLGTLLAETNDPVFVEMTAAWCITCKVNHAVAINISSTKQAFKNNNVQYLQGDWTNQDPAITEYLNSFGRNGVPIYVYYGPKNNETGQRPEPKVLPQILTPKMLTDIFKKES